MGAQKTVVVTIKNSFLKQKKFLLSEKPRRLAGSFKNLRTSIPCTFCSKFDYILDKLKTTKNFISSTKYRLNLNLIYSWY